MKRILIINLSKAINNGSLQNVMDLLKINFVEKQTNALFVLLFIIPVLVVCISLVCALVFNKKHLETSTSQISSNGYTKLLTEEAVLDLEEDREIFS